MTACVGFVHSAFAFGQESFIAAKFAHGPSVHITSATNTSSSTTSSVHTSSTMGGGGATMTSADSKASVVPPGMLISLLQRGLHYAAIEFHLNDDGTEKECTRPYSLLEPHVCERPSTAAAGSSSTHPMSGYHPTSTRSSAKPIAFKPDIAKGESTKSDMSKDEPVTMSTLTTAATTKKKERENGAASSAKKRKKEDQSSSTMPTSVEPGEPQESRQQPPPPPQQQQQQPKKKKSPKKNGTGKKGAAASSSASGEISSFASVSTLVGHESEVITCAWNPAKDISLLASASGDGTSRLWTVPADGPWDADEAKMTVRILDHRQTRDALDNLPAQSTATGEESSQDVTTMDWSPDGQVLATGCYDGRARLWSLDGDLLAVLSQHRGPIFQLHWSPTGRLLATAGLEPSVAIWDVSGRTLLRSYAQHAAPALDVDWRDDETFATCATDRLIHIYKVDQSEPTLILSGHQDEVNSIKWSADGQLLLSSSDDHTARIWRISADGRQGELLATLADHAQEIYTAKWGRNIKAEGSPSGAPTNSNLSSSTPSSSLLATASFDGTVRLWSFSLTGPSPTVHCIHVLRKHTQPVYAIDFSPCGNYLASGSLDGALILWSLEEGRPLRTYQGKGGIFEVTWSNATGESSIISSSGIPAALPADHQSLQNHSHRLAACTSERELIVLDTGTNNLLL